MLVREGVNRFEFVHEGCPGECGELSERVEAVGRPEAGARR